MHDWSHDECCSGAVPLGPLALSLLASPRAIPVPSGTRAHYFRDRDGCEVFMLSRYLPRLPAVAKKRLMRAIMNSARDGAAQALEVRWLLLVTDVQLYINNRSNGRENRQPVSKRGMAWDQNNGFKVLTIHVLIL